MNGHVRLALAAAVVGGAALLGVRLVAGNGPEATNAAPEATVLGTVGDFPAHSVRRVELEVDYLDTAPLDAAAADTAAVRQMQTIPVYVVNRPPEPLLALFGRSPFLGCRVLRVTRTEALDFSASNVPHDFSGGFVDPCHGGLFTTDGRHVGGPGVRGLDRFPVTERPDGVLTIDLNGLEPGPAS